jgi:hypothetical protein
LHVELRRRQVGVEYRHFLVVNDASWRPQADTVARVEAELRKWGVVREVKEVVDLSLGAENRLIDISSTASPGPGIAVIYSGIDGPLVERVAGPSAYESVGSHERYITDTTIVVGNDLRIQWSTDSIYFELVSPPMANGAAVASDPDEEPYDILFAQSFPSENMTAPPVVAARIADHARASVAWSECLGFWRAALVIDFGKDLPSFSEEVHALPARDFVAAISDAFRGQLVEIGEFY